MAFVAKPRGLAPPENDEEDAGVKRTVARGKAPIEEEAAAGEDAGGGGSVDGRQPNASPEEQETYNQFVLNGHVLIYERRKTFENIVQRLKMGKEQNNPVGALADVALMIVQRLEKGAPGGKLDPGIIMQGGVEIGMEIAEIAKLGGIHEYSDEEIKAAIVQAADKYRVAKAKQGETDPDQAKMDIQRLKEADESGDLEREFPGMRDAFSGPPQGGEGDEESDPDEQEDDGDDDDEEEKPYRGLNGE